MKNTYDAIVIGAGAMGSAAAYYLAKRGQRVLLLEQFEIDHRKGSSYGYSRIIRYSYDHPEYVDLMQDTFPLWFALEHELGKTLYHQTGGIDFGPADDNSLRATIEAVDTSGISHELLSAEEARDRFPQFRFPRRFPGAVSARQRFRRCFQRRARTCQVGAALRRRSARQDAS